MLKHASLGIEEYTARQRGILERAASNGFAGVLAWSRGGQTHDHAADLLYLCGFYPPQPFVPDFGDGGNGAGYRWHWRAAGHAALVMMTDGRSALVADSAPRDDVPRTYGELILTGDIVGGVIEIIRRFGGSGSDAADDSRQGQRIALFGGEALSGLWLEDLRTALTTASISIIPADNLLWTSRCIKSAWEMDQLRRAGALGVQAMEAAMDASVTGATEAEILAESIALITRGGGAWYGGGLSSGPLASDFAPTGGPSGVAPCTMRALEKGDLVRLDIYGSLGGYIFDFARTWVVGKSPSPEQQLLLDAVRDSVRAGIELMRPGITLGAVARACEAKLEQCEFVRRNSIPLSTMGGAWGHGVGLGFEPPWITADSEVVIVPGMCFALERRIEAPSANANARGAQYEDNLLVTAEGAETITPSRAY